MCKEYKDYDLFNSSKNIYAEFLKGQGFLNNSAYNKMSVMEILFKLRSDKILTQIINNDYDTYINEKMETITVSKLLPIDCILEMISINRISDYIIDKFVEKVREDSSIMEENAIDFLINLITAKGRFFSLFKE